MKKLILSLTLLILITSASANIEQHEGFPVYVGSGLVAQLAAKDIDGDGKLEIIASPENRMVKVFDHKGAIKWENVGGRVQDDYGRVPVVSNLTGDSRLETVSYGNPGWSDATFYIWDSTGIKLKEFWVGKYLVISSPALTKEGLILTGAAPGRAFSAIAGATGVHAFDSQGNKLWYLELGKSVNFRALIPVGDINEDGVDEAVILTQDIGSANPVDGKAWVIKATGTQGTILWSVELGGDARGAAIGDLNNDGMPEIIVASSSGVHVFDTNGNELYKYAINSNRASPVIADIDGDGINEALVASRVDNKIYTISNGILKEFPAEQVSSNIATGDINNDGKLEIVAGNQDGKLYVWDYTGKLLDTANVAKKYQYFTSALIADLEGDGSKEIILGNSNGNIFVYTYGKKDITPPETTDNVDSAWHNTNVTITLEAKDEESGVAATYYSVDGSEPTKDSAKGTNITLSEEGVYTIKYFSVDNAGNTEQVKTAVNKVRIDKTPPSTTDDSNGKWHNSSVTVTLTAKDPGSEVIGIYYSLDGSEFMEGTVILISSDGIHTLKYYSVDNAGNKEGTKEVVARIDSAPPVTTDDSDSMWHNSDVRLNIATSDSLSGIAFLRYRMDGVEQVSDSSNINLTFTEEGVHEVKYYAVDNAGNEEYVKTAVVKIDQTPPSTTDDSDGQWHNTSVIVKLAASDNLAGVQSTGYKVNSDTKPVMESFFSWLYNAIGLAEAATSQGDAVYIPDEGVFSIQYNSMDNANNIETEITSKQVKIDKTQPIIAGASTTLPNSNVWYNNDVTVHFTAKDTLSGIELLTPDQTLSGEGAFQSVTGTAVDKAGNSASITVTDINIDKTAPAITGSRTSPNAQGWYNADVTVHFDCSDGLSGLERCTPDRIVSTEGAGQGVNGSAVDKAGNSAGKTVEGINIDKTLPSITVTSPLNNTYLHSDIITLGFKAQDVLSGLRTLTSAIDGTGDVSDGQTIDMLGLSFGAHEFYIFAEDNAGNANNRRVGFNVIATIDSVKALTERGATNGWISNKGIANSLSAKLNSARAKLDAGQKTAAKNILEAYINEVEAQTGKAITSEGAGILRAEARYVIEHL